jgi:hypothetical protein
MHLMMMMMMMMTTLYFCFIHVCGLLRQCVHVATLLGGVLFFEFYYQNGTENY